MSSSLLATLSVVCPSCDHLNAPREAQCSGCGASLVEGGPKPAPRPAPPAPVPSLAASPVEGTNPTAAPPARPNLEPAARAVPLAEAPPPPSRPEQVPPGMRPTRAESVRAAPAPRSTPVAPAAQPRAAPQPAPAAPVERKAEPIPASELVRKPAAPRPAAATGPRFGLLMLAGANRGQRYRLPPSGVVIGRTRGAILFPEDPYVSPHHATLTVRDGKLLVRDESSTSGVYVSVSQETVPVAGCFAVGQRLFRFQGALPHGAGPEAGVVLYGAPLPLSQVYYCVEELLVGDRPGRALISANALLTIGQAKCDLSYPGDEGLAARHCELTPMPTGALLRDLSGGLGTFVRLQPSTERPLKPGDRLRIGQEVMQVEAAT